MRISGPLVHKWALRFEGKHRFFKRIPSVMPNFKNICKTFAKRHSLSQLFAWRSGSAMKGIECGPGKLVYSVHLPSHDNSALSGAETSAEQVLCVNWNRCYGTQYSIGMLVAFKLLHDEASPVFGQITHILSYPSGNVYFLLMPFETVGFDTHYHSYVIDAGSGCDQIAVPVHGLVDHNPITSFTVKKDSSHSETMVSVRYSII